MNKGFTLIELLVVVLIIGILAAIALPQYQKAVERSRMAEAMQALGDWAQAQSIYYMQHNAFTENINEGDITLSEPGDAFTYEVIPLEEENAILLLAERSAGIYEGGKLAIGVVSNGQIATFCQDPPDKTGFCTAAEAAGYMPEDLSGLEEDIGGGNNPQPGPGNSEEECPPGSYWDGFGCRSVQR